MRRVGLGRAPTPARSRGIVFSPRRWSVISGRGDAGGRRRATAWPDSGRRARPWVPPDETDTCADDRALDRLRRLSRCDDGTPRGWRAARRLSVEHLSTGRRVLRKLARSAADVRAGEVLAAALAGGRRAAHRNAAAAPARGAARDDPARRRAEEFCALVLATARCGDLTRSDIQRGRARHLRRATASDRSERTLLARTTPVVGARAEAPPGRTSRDAGRFGGVALCGRRAPSDLRAPDELLQRTSIKGRGQ